jgi:hypothetical protein
VSAERRFARVVLPDPGKPQIRINLTTFSCTDVDL